MTPTEIRTVFALKNQPLTGIDRTFVGALVNLHGVRPKQKLTIKQKKYLYDLAARTKVDTNSINPDPNPTPPPMECVTLRLLAKELARGGYLKNEPWVFFHAHEAEQIYHEYDERMLQCAVLLSVLHPYALSYLKSCPVLVHVITKHGDVGPGWSYDERQRVTKKWAELFTQTPKLRVLMDSVGIAYPLRKIKPMGPIKADFLKDISRIPPSTLSQIIPDDDHQQDMWVRHLGGFHDTLVRRQRANRNRQQHINERLPDYLEWAGRALHKIVHEVGYPNIFNFDHLADFVFDAPDRFDLNWSAETAIEQAELWHDELRGVAHIGTDFEGEVDYAPFPNEWIDPNTGLIFVGLRTARALRNEGAILHNCIGSYCGDVSRGNSLIYSIRDHGHLAAMELNPTSTENFNLSQLNGSCNASVTNPKVLQAVSNFFEALRKQEKPLHLLSVSWTLTPYFDPVTATTEVEDA